MNEREMIQKQIESERTPLNLVRGFIGLGAYIFFFLLIISPILFAIYATDVLSHGTNCSIPGIEHCVKFFGIYLWW